MQNLATDHADALGLSGDTLIRECGAVWMIARQYIRLRRPIAYSDALRITTWHRGADKTPTVLRDFDIFAGEERVGEAVMSWVLANVATRKLVKPLSVPIVADSKRPAAVKDIVPAKIPLPEGMAKVLTRTVNYSDTDINGHMNNTRYADVACDALRYDRHSGRFIAEAQFNYLQESFPGDELDIFAAQHGGTHYVRGADGGGKPRFDVSLTILAIG